MKKKMSLYTILVAASVTMLYLMIPACGNQSNNQPYPYNGYGNQNCIPGQQCLGGLGGFGGQGVPLLPGIVMASIDSYGSIAQMQFGGTNVIAGQPYNGPMTVTGVIQMNPGGVCPPGSYQIQGQGNWSSGSGIPTLQANLTVVGPGGQMQGQISGNIFSGNDPYAPQMNSQFYFRGNFGTSCNPGGVAL